MLKNSYFSKQKDTNPEVKVCETKRCGICPYLKQGKKLTYPPRMKHFG